MHTNATVMKWYNTKDRVPSDGQEVLVRSAGTVNLAKYNQAESCFVLRNASKINSKEAGVEWMELIAPDQGR